jgi:uncharacterized protein (DUF1800 family)
MKSVLPLAVIAVLGAQVNVAQNVSARAAARLLDQATWGPTPASIAQVQSMGIENWLQAQFAADSSDLPDQAILTLDGTSNNDLTPVQAAFFQNALGGNDQLRQRVAFILSQIWVVSATSGVPNAYAYPPYWRIFRDNAFGNYRDLIKAVSLNPAMGRYLNMANNNKGNAAKNISPNENYARELMQLFTIGLTQLNPNGTPVPTLDLNQSPVTYDQSVVTNTARLLTGWTYPTAPGATAKTNNPAYYFGQMFAVESEHDATSKTIVGNVVVPAGQTAEQDLESLLDTLMAQPSMAPFISQQLIQHLVTSNPSPAYIQRIAQVFQNDGTGVTANLQAVISAILTDEEARAGDVSPSAVTANFGHLREPILFMTNVLRGLNATLASTNAAASAASSLGENLFFAPSVFSYFSPQYRTQTGLLGPEFQIYSTQTAATRADIVNSLLYGTLSGIKVDLSSFTALAGNTSQLLDGIASVFLHGAMSTQLETEATSAVNAQSTALAKTEAALYMVLTSSEYQVIQ